VLLSGQLASACQPCCATLPHGVDRRIERHDPWQGKVFRYLQRKILTRSGMEFHLGAHCAPGDVPS